LFFGFSFDSGGGEAVFCVKIKLNLTCNNVWVVMWHF